MDHVRTVAICVVGKGCGHKFPTIIMKMMHEGHLGAMAVAEINRAILCITTLQIFNGLLR